MRPRNAKLFEEGVAGFAGQVGGQGLVVLASFFKLSLHPFDNVGELGWLQLFVRQLDVSRTTGSPTTRLTTGCFGELAGKVAPRLTISRTLTSRVQGEAL